MSVLEDLLSALGMSAGKGPGEYPQAGEEDQTYAPKVIGGGYNSPEQGNYQPHQNGVLDTLAQALGIGGGNQDGSYQNTGRTVTVPRSGGYSDAPGRPVEDAHAQGGGGGDSWSVGHQGISEEELQHAIFKAGGGYSNQDVDPYANLKPDRILSKDGPSTSIGDFLDFGTTVPVGDSESTAKDFATLHAKNAETIKAKAHARALEGVSQLLEKLHADSKGAAQGDQFVARGDSISGGSRLAPGNLDSGSSGNFSKMGYGEQTLQGLAIAKLLQNSHLSEGDKRSFIDAGDVPGVDAGAIVSGALNQEHEQNKTLQEKAMDVITSTLGKTKDAREGQLAMAAKLRILGISEDTIKHWLDLSSLKTS